MTDTEPEELYHTPCPNCGERGSVGELPHRGTTIESECLNDDCPVLTFEDNWDNVCRECGDSFENSAELAKHRLEEHRNG